MGRPFRFLLAFAAASGFGLLVELAPPAAQAQFGYSRYHSPPAVAAATIAGKAIRIDYYAPSMHGRKIMGDLVPFGEVWCTGANWATQITTPADLMLGDINLPKGSYTIWTIPDEKEWTLIINKETGQFHTDYNPEADFARTKMKVKALDAPVERFTIALRPGNDNHGTLALIWEKTEASVSLKVLP
jgi:Protein of unknown function (DUF2911)